MMFETYVALLRKWQAAKNLVGPATLDTIWTRHIADSAQLFSLAPDARRWVDIGSGAGFPGLVLAIMGKSTPGFHVDLVESNGRKCAFLREVVRTLGLPVSVHNGRIEDVLDRLTGARRRPDRPGPGAAVRSAATGAKAVDNRDPRTLSEGSRCRG